MAGSRAGAGSPPSGPPAGDEAANPPISFAAAAARRGREPYYGDEVEDAGGDGGGGPPEGDNVRIARLEVHVSHVQSALGEIRSDIKDVAKSLHHLPTKQDLTTNLAVIVTIAIAVVGIIVGAMGWLETRAARVAPPAPAAQAAQPAPAPPIIVQVPYPQSSERK